MSSVGSLSHCNPEFKLANNVCTIELPDHPHQAAGRHSKAFAVHRSHSSSHASMGATGDPWHTGVFEPKAFVKPKPAVDTQPKGLHAYDGSRPEQPPTDRPLQPKCLSVCHTPTIEQEQQQHHQSDRPMTETSLGSDREAVVDSLRVYLKEWGQQQEALLKNALDEIVHVASNIPAGGRDGRRRRTRGLISKDLTGMAFERITTSERTPDGSARRAESNQKPLGLPIPRSASDLVLAATNNSAGDTANTPRTASPDYKSAAETPIGNSLALTAIGDGEFGRSKNDLQEIVASRQTRRSHSAEVLWNFLEEPDSSQAAKWYAAVTPPFILLTLIVGLMEIVADPALEGELAFSLEVSFDCIFALEILVRFATSPDRNVFFFNPYNLIDMSALATLGFRVWTFVYEGASKFDAPAYAYNTPSIAHVIFWCFVPVMRCLRLLRRFQEFHLLLEAFKMAFEALPVLLYLYFVKMLVFAGLIYAFEPSDNVESLTHSMWLTIVTMTTLGYGDVYPVSTGGRVVVAVLVVTSSLYMAVPLGIIGSCFSEVWQNRQRILLLRSLRSRLTQHGYTAWDIPQLFHHFDADCDGNFDYAEFKTMVEHLGIYIPEVKLVNIFDNFDVDGSGTVDDRDLVKALFPLSYHLMYDKDGELKDPPQRRKVSVVNRFSGGA